MGVREVEERGSTPTALNIPRLGSSFLLMPVLCISLCPGVPLYHSSMYSSSLDGNPKTKGVLLFNALDFRHEGDTIQWKAVFTIREGKTLVLAPLTCDFVALGVLFKFYSILSCHLLLVLCTRSPWAGFGIRPLSPGLSVYDEWASWHITSFSILSFPFSKTEMVASVQPPGSFKEDIMEYWHDA